MQAVFGIVLLLCCLAHLSQAWRCSPGPRLNGAQQIDAGMGSVVATAGNRPYFLSGSSWYRLGPYSIQRMTVGPVGIWGTYGNKLYKYVGGSFRPVQRTSVGMVDAGSKGPLVGVSSARYATCMREAYALHYNGRNSLFWTSLGKQMRYFSCGQLGCWGVDLPYNVFYREPVSSTCGIKKFTAVPTGIKGLTRIQMRVVEAATDGKVFAVSTSGQVYERTGISSGRPTGSGWRQVDSSKCLKARHVSYDLGQLWVVTTTGTIMKCTH